MSKQEVITPDVCRISVNEASRQLYESELLRIGEDEPAVRLEDGSVEDWEPIYRNRLRAELRAKARAFYGITETEEEGK